jgi:hypothetical protein
MQQEPQSTSSPSQPLPIILAILPEDERDPDPAAINTVGRSIVGDLERDGYTVKPISTGQRGGLELLFQVVTNTLQTVGAEVWAQKDVLGILSDLCTIFGFASPLVLHLLRKHEKQPAQGHEVKVSIRIDEAEIEVTAADVADDEHVLRLSERFLALHPSAKVTPHSKVKVQGRVAKGQYRRRR